VQVVTAGHQAGGGQQREDGNCRQQRRHQPQAAPEVEVARADAAIARILLAQQGGDEVAVPVPPEVSGRKIKNPAIRRGYRTSVRCLGLELVDGTGIEPVALVV